MYLRRIKDADGYHYLIRESYRAGEGWRHRDLQDLGADPRVYIHYPGGNGFYIDQAVEDALQQRAVRYTSEDLEKLFRPFLDPHIRMVLERFERPRPVQNEWRTRSPEELLRLQAQLHSFDKRRLHYLRCGRVDIGNLEGRAWKFLNPLLGKCRDEIEHMFDCMESRLRPHEVCTYLYTALHLQRHFRDHLTRHHPAALDPQRVDSCFMEELCRLNTSSRFTAGIPDHDEQTLHPYLVKYVILYFDSDFERHGSWSEYMRSFTGRQYSFRRPPARPSMPVRDACRVLAISVAQFEAMDRAQLVRHYRRRAKAVHPDQGGDHEAFVTMTQAYECLLARK